jgi:hypothetical protein
MSDQTFYEYIFNEHKIAFHKDAVIKVQLGKKLGKYDTKLTFSAKDFAQAVMHYNMLNVGRGYKKRLYCETLNNPTLHKVLS